MSKKIKMVIYGEPGVGKSVFASKAPKPFFITTDGNYEWLEDFGADPDAHKQVNSWEEAKKAFTMDFSAYDTIVVDLLEDLFKWCEYEYCVRNKLEHVSDIGFAKGYDSTRTEFFIEICKLIALDKNVIFIMHGISFTTKDRRGVEHIKHAPSTRLPDKVTDMIEGRVRYFLRCYLKDEEQTDGTILKCRYLSLVPKPNEFGIIRGVNENNIPQDIPLDFNIFAKTLGLSFDNSIADKKPKQSKKQTEDENLPDLSSNIPPEVEAVDNEESTVEKVEEAEASDSEESTTEKTEEVKTNDSSETTEAEKTTETVTEKPMSNADKLAAIRAKLAKVNANK